MISLLQSLKMQLRCIIVDDEPMARKGMEEELREITFVELVGIAENSYQAIDLVSTLRPELILLDIELPGLNGLDLIKSLRQPPMVIITTAYSEYALKGYELDVMDFLIKPVDFSRLLKACCKAQDFHTLRHQAAGSGMPGSSMPSGDGYFFVKSNGKYEKIIFKDLLFVEAADNYVLLHTNGKRFMVYDTLKNMESLLPAKDFMKVHKSFIIALDKVSLMEGNILKIEHAKIPVSRNLKDSVMERIIRT
jgi:DNA-binding LytR/AlgR family response regulator